MFFLSFSFVMTHSETLYPCRRVTNFSNVLHINKAVTADALIFCLPPFLSADESSLSSCVALHHAGIDGGNLPRDVSEQQGQ